MYWKVCDMEKEGKLNVRQHIEKERLQLNEITPHLSKFATFSGRNVFSFCIQGNQWPFLASLEAL